MKRDSRLSIALHILTHLALAGDRPTTSEVMASHLHTNPVVVRRSLAGLRNAGIVTSVKGHGGGWTLARAASTISLGEVGAILGEGADLLDHPAPDGCRVDAAVRSSLEEAYQEANTLLLDRLNSITLADLANAVNATPGPSQFPESIGQAMTPL